MSNGSFDLPFFDTIHYVEVTTRTFYLLRLGDSPLSFFLLRFNRQQHFCNLFLMCICNYDPMPKSWWNRMFPNAFLSAIKLLNTGSQRMKSFSEICDVGRERTSTHQRRKVFPGKKSQSYSDLYIYYVLRCYTS